MDSDLVIIKRAPFNAESPAGALAAPITPTPQIYVRSNFAVPELPGDAHRIAVGGAVHHPFEVSVGELKAAVEPPATVTVTMECAGNDRLTMRPLPRGELWQSGAVSTSRWTGVPLRMLLDRAGVEPAAVEILVEGADAGTVDGGEATGFGRSLPLSKALDPHTLLAFAVNDQPLTPAHGAPVRLVVPGWYGMASVKWMTRVTALTRPYDGYFQRRRYVYEEPGRTIEPVTAIRVKSMITSPSGGSTVPRGRVTIAGWAWSGDGAITRVEVAVAGGAQWREARVSPAASPYAWTPWSAEWEPEAPGRYALRSRASDSSGAVQPDEIPWNRLGYGNNAVRPIVVDVV